MPGLLDFFNKLPNLFRQKTVRPQPGPDVSPAAEGTPAPITRRVLLITHDPAMPPAGSRPLHAHLGWQDPEALAASYISEMAACSYGYLNYEIVGRVLGEPLPVKVDGFRYTADSFEAAWRGGRFHDPDGMDYLTLVRQYGILDQVSRNAIDEVWLFGPPGAGYWESIMAGPGAFFCNAPPLRGTENCARRFVIMGFNYERQVGQMMEAFGHRAESILRQVFATRPGGEDLFARFSRYDKVTPGQAEVGLMHFAPNSVADYDWSNPTIVPSRCDNWLHFPDLSGAPRPVTRDEWGGNATDADIVTRDHHRWWFRRLPHATGQTSGISGNWWEYVVDPQRVRV
jgi:hypothetical protein